MNDKKIKYLVLFTAFIDVIGLGIVIPVLPFYVERFTGSPFTVAALFAVFALCSFLSSPWIGALSDRYGRRPALLVSIASTALGWFIFAAAQSLWVLYLGRIVDGLAAGNLPVAQSALVDLAKDDRERTANLGLIGAVFGVAFVIGPFIGGALGHISHTLPFWFVGFLATANLIGAYFFLPETRNIRPSQASAASVLNPFAPIIRAARDRVLRSSYIAWFLFGLATAATHAVFTLYLSRVFGYREFISGIIFAAMGMVIAVNQAFLMRKFWLKRFKEPMLELVMLGIFAIGYLVLAIPYQWSLVAGLLGITFGQSVLRVVMSSQMVSKSQPSMRGEVMGIAMSVISLAAGISPFAAGALFKWHVSAPFILSAGILCLAFLVLFRERRRLTGPLSPDTPVISEI